MSNETEARLARALTGAVAGDTGLPTGFGEQSVRCARCGSSLSAGEEVAALVREFDGRRWETVAFRCLDHADDELASLTAVHGDEQALVTATLEPTGYHDPRDGFQPDALTLGGVEVREFSGGGSVGESGDDNR